MQAFINAKEKDLKLGYQSEILSTFDMSKVRQFLRYGKPFFINFEKVRDPQNTFVLPIFIRPGRTHLMLRTPMDHDVKARVDHGVKVRILNYQKQSDVHFRFYYNRHIVPHREERCQNVSDQEDTSSV